MQDKCLKCPRVSRQIVFQSMLKNKDGDSESDLSKIIVDQWKIFDFAKQSTNQYRATRLIK